MATLRELTDDLVFLESLFEDPDTDEQTIKDTMESVMFDFENKTDSYGTVIKDMEGKMEMLGKEIERLQKKKKSLENGIIRMKGAIKESIIKIGEKKVSGDLFSFTVKNNAPQLPEKISPVFIPDKFYKPQEPKLDRVNLLKAVKAGKVKGIELVRSQSLLIK